MTGEIKEVLDAWGLTDPFTVISLFIIFIMTIMTAIGLYYKGYFP